MSPRQQKLTQNVVELFLYFAKQSKEKDSPQFASIPRWCSSEKLRRNHLIENEVFMRWFVRKAFLRLQKQHMRLPLASACVVLVAHWTYQYFLSLQFLERERKNCSGAKQGFDFVFQDIWMGYRELHSHTQRECECSSRNKTRVAQRLCLCATLSEQIFPRTRYSRSSSSGWKARAQRAIRVSRKHTPRLCGSTSFRLSVPTLL